MRYLNLPVESLIEQYNAGYSTEYLAKMYNCSLSTIQRRLKETIGLKSVGSNRKYSLNERYFDVINTEDKAYWLGLLLTDGSTSGKLIRLSFQHSDEPHLEKFLVAISSNHPIKHKVNDNFIQSCVSIGNKHMREILLCKGIIANEKRPFKISPELERHYWRGAIDGDGKIDIKYQTIRLVGTEEVCEAFKAFCQRCVKTKSNVARQGNIFSYRLHGELAYNLLSVLYKQSSIHLDRKYQQFLDWTNIYNEQKLYPKVVRFFKKHFQGLNLSILKCRMPKNLEGLCSYDEGKYTIKISDRLNDSEAVNCLLHELAHINSLLEDTDPHGNAFGIAYSNIYKLYEAEFTQ